VEAVIARRQALRIRKFDPPWHVWTPAEEKLLGQKTDQQVATRLGLAKRAVAHHRRRLGLEARREPNR